jgi:heat-inducible transcriptional repressor
VILALESDLVQTMTIETSMMPTAGTIDDVKRLINDRLVGRPLRLLSEVFPEVHSDSTESTPTLVRLFVEHVERLGSVSTGSTVHVTGAQQLLTLPEFDDPERMRSVIELIENEDVIIHLVDTANATDGVNVKIGNELQHEQLTDYSLVTTTYRVGSATGSVSLIGPKRMQYSRMMSLVQMVSNALNTSFDTSH